MLIENVDGKTPPYHVASGIGRALIATGAAREVVPTIPSPVPNTSWQAREGYRGPDYVEPPIIAYSCASCGVRGSFSGPTCEKTQRLHHCGVAEEVPSDVQTTFRTLRIAWDRRHKQATKPSISWCTPGTENLSLKPTGVQDLRKK